MKCTVLKDFFFLYSFIFFCGIYTQSYVMCKGDHCLVTLQAYTCDLGVGITTVFEIIGHLLFKRGRPFDHFVWSWPTYHYMLLDTRNKNLYGLGVGISVVLRYYNTSCLRGDRTTMYHHDLHTIRCYLT
jgi:hypothetical protein